MSMMGQMSFFLSLQVSQNPEGIFINLSKYASEILKIRQEFWLIKPNIEAWLVHSCISLQADPIYSLLFACVLDISQNLLNVIWKQ